MSKIIYFAKRKKIIYLLITLLLIAIVPIAYFSIKAPEPKQIPELKNQDRVSPVGTYPQKVEPTKTESSVNLEAKRDSIKQEAKNDSIAKFAMKDERFYKNALAKNTTEAFNGYQKAFPGGKYIKQAEQKIGKLENEKLQMVFVKGGAFVMGDDNGEYWEKPAHKVVVSDFYIGRYEVTQKQWTELMGTNPSFFKGCDNCPVESVNWHDVQEFIKKLNQKTGLAYRLPTEAEWEYAAGASTGSATSRTKYAGTNKEDELGDYAWYEKNSDNKTHPVGTKKPNNLGIYDMSGNVWEWCSDWYIKDYYGKSQLNNPKGPSSGLLRALRSGSLINFANKSRVACRSIIMPNDRWYCNGVRLSLDDEMGK